MGIAGFAASSRSAERRAKGRAAEKVRNLRREWRDRDCAGVVIIGESYPIPGCGFAIYRKPGGARISGLSGFAGKKQFVVSWL